MDKSIDISVYVLTYFHEKYIRQALDSILIQKTHYEYEIVISDDCSQDNTCLIIKEYVKRYPNKIRAIFNKSNIGIPKNIYQARCACNGRYIVALSGDDYWIDQYKLQKQAAFLDEHEEYIAVCNAMELRYDDDNVPFNVLPKRNDTNQEFTLLDYENGKILYTHGFMMRNFFLTEEGRRYFLQAQLISDKVDDAVDNVLMLMRGKVYVADFLTDVYRVPRKKENAYNYNSIVNNIDKVNNSICLLNSLFNYYQGKINLKQRYIKTTAVAIYYSVRTLEFKAYYEIYKKIPLIYRKEGIILQGGVELLFLGIELLKLKLIRSRSDS